MRLYPQVALLLIATIIATVSAAGQHQRVVCYYTNWSVYRPGNAKFNPQNINPYLCTHLIYAFGGLTKENGLRPFDKYQDVEQGGYAKFNGLKSYNKNLKTLLAIGGWNEGSARFSPLVADSERRAEFVKNVVRFLRVNHFDGLDLDWEYPAFRDGGKPRDRANYALLVQELRAEFDRESSKTGRERLLLTMAVPAGTEYVDKGYDVPSLNKHLDFFNILSYDYHSAFEPVVNHHAPLYSGGDPDNEYNFDAQLSIEHTVKHYVTMGADRDKLVLGIPTYGRSYTLFNPLATELGSAADGPGEQGDATREKGYLAYYEICENVKKQDWTVERPKPDEMGPIAYKGNQWVGYDDEDIVRVKAQYVAAQGLGGIMFWSIDNDDFRGKCHDRPYPLIEAGKEALLAATKGTDGKRPKPSSSSSGSVKPASRRRPTSSVSTSVRNGDTSSSKRRRPVAPAPRVTSSPITSTTPVPPNLSLLNTPEPPTTPDPGSDFKCEDEGFFPHPRDCKKYFWCLDSGPSQLGIVAHQFTCPSGLVFNKAADSCDYARNVICSKTPKTTTTTAAPTTVAVSTTRSPLLRTTTTTTTTTTPAPEEEEEEYEEYEEDIEEDPKAIKELLDLIKRLGGVEQLERQFGGGREEAPEVPEVAERPNISKSLYQRVLGSRGKITNSGGGSVISAERIRPDTSERKLPSSLNTRSRGPQNQGLDDLEEVRGLKKEKPKYVEIRRPSRPSTRPVSEEDDEEPQEEVEEEYEEEAAPAPPKRTSFSRPNNTPKYTSIRRERPASTAAPEEPEEPETPIREEQPKRKYVSLSRTTSTTESQQTAEDEDAVDDVDEIPAVVREVPAPPKTALEFEGRVEEVTKVGYRRGNTLRRHTAELSTYPQIEDTISVVNAEPTRATAGFYITKSPTQRVFVVNAVTTTSTTTTESLPETTLTTEPPLTTTTQELPTTLDEVTSVTETETPTVAPMTTSTSTSIVTSITEDPMYGRKKIKINRKLNYTIAAKTDAPTTPMTTMEDSTEMLTTTTFEPEIIEPSTTTTAKPLRKKRPLLVRKRPVYTPKPTEESASVKPARRRRPSAVVNRTNLEEVITEASVTPSTSRFQRKRVRIQVSTTPEPTSTSASRRRFRPAKPTSSAIVSDEQTPRTFKYSRPSTEVASDEVVSQPIRSFRPFRTTTTTEASSQDYVSIARTVRPLRPSTEASEASEEYDTPPRGTFRPQLKFDTETTSDEFVTPARTFRPNRVTESPEEIITTVRTPSRRRKIIRIRGRQSTTPTSTTTTTPLPPLEDDEEAYDDSGASASGNEVFLLSSSQSGPNQDEDVIEDNEILSAIDDDNQNHHLEATTTSTSTEAPARSTSRPLVSIRPLTRRPFPAPRVRASSTTTTPAPIESEEPSSTSSRPRVVLRRKFRPFKETEKGREVDALTSSTRSSRRRQQNNLHETTTVSVAETSPLLSQQSPAVYYTKNPIDESVTEVNLDQDYDLANGAVAALTNLATSPPSAPAAPIYEEIPYEPSAPEQVEEVQEQVTTPAPTFAPSTTHRPRLSSTLAPRKSQRAQRPASTVAEQQPFTRLRGNNRQQSVIRATTTTQGPLDFEDYYDDEVDPSIPTSSKVQIHEDGSLECLDRGNFAHPFSCRKFISCALMENGALLGWIYTCPKHLAFDPIGGICNWSGGCKE